MISEAGDANGNKVTRRLASKVVGGILYPSIETITDGVGRVTSLPVNAQGLLDKIKAPGYETTGLSFTYDGSNRLAEITYEDGLSTSFTYDNLNLLTSVTNHDGRKLTIEYEAYAPYRVKRVTESNGETVGNRREYSYSHLTTTVTDRTVPGGKQLFYAFNASGNLISAHDLLGHAMVANFTAEEPINHPKSISKKMRAVVNLLRNHGWNTATAARCTTSATRTSG